MKKQINFNVEDLERYYGKRIAELEITLARETAAKNAVIRYSEDLEGQLGIESDES